MSGKFIQGVGKNYYEFTGQIKWETERAIKFFDGNVEVWIPRQFLEGEPESVGKGMVTITIPEWLAEDKELL